MSALRNLVVIGLALALGACVTFVNPVSQTQVYQLENAYGVAQSLAVAYTQLPRCGPGENASATNLCSQHSTIVKLAQADKSARATLTEAATFVRNNPTLSAAQVLAEARSALALFQQIEATYGVH